ncbi:MAG: formate/nitrite transporter family protein [Planctomycetes bacterium]|nr:formate/nitrite transporter family protein [Planctomycetota bacterium]
MTPPIVDALPPKEIARKVETVGVQKARTDALTLLVLGILAGAFISLGGLFYTVAITDSGLGFGTTRVVGGLSFCLGLILVVVAGAELFTGNNLIAMAWASGLVSLREVARNWTIVYLGNVAGCLGTVALVAMADLGPLGGGGLGETAIKIARGKAELSLPEALVRGILCNALVCLAVWLSMGGRSVTDKILAIVFPITAFVAVGLEHSIANWFFLPLGIALADDGVISIAGAARNIVAVTCGNILGGTLLVAGIYWLAYLRRGDTDD